MLSKVIKQKISERYAKGDIRYPKDCDGLAIHISQVCKTRISSSTLRRLYGFVKGIREPRLHTLDIVAEYIGHKGWEELIASFERTESEPEKLIDKLKPEQIKAGQAIQLTYEPAKVIEIRKVGGQLQVVTSNEKRVLVNDEVRFKLLELHYPLTFTHHFRQGSSLGKLQLATVSGITSIKRV
jgi:hypothetical protein